ncbi:MAG: BamA/TamA family outer membrane protein [Paludibacteraceae bacterium]|nr:BamA/TamA family outer membrane protein [Paludibacteraceae bacterium]
MRKIFFILLFVFGCAKLLAQSDSLLDVKTAQKHTFYVVPTINYQPETSWGFGVAGANYFKYTDEKRISNLSYGVEYTLKNQFSVSVYPKIYFTSSNWYLYANLGYKRYPNAFFGIGNSYEKSSLEKKISYNSNAFFMNVQPQYFLTDKWLIGVAMSMRWEKLIGNQVFPTEIIGVKPYFLWGIGGVVSYDSRNNLFYPTSGMFFKTLFHYYEPYLGNSFRMGQFSAEFRQFVTIYKEFVFAWQAKTEMAFGDVPFQLLPTFGGCDQMRGFRNGRWRDDMSIFLQAEFRLPIWWRLKAAVFGSIGDVYNWNDWNFSIPKIAYGAGLRLRLNKAKVNLRFDVARQNYDDWKNFRKGWGFYFTASEAF